MSVLYPTAAIRELVAETAHDPDLTADAKARELGLLREELTVLVGEIDRTVQGARKLAEAEHLSSTERMIELRESADIREELISRGLATESEMAALGYPSHDEIDRTIGERLGLEESLVGDLRKKWEELKHPRGRGGRFREVPGHSLVGQHTKGGLVKRVLEDTQSGQQIPVFHGPSPTATHEPDLYEKRRLAQEERTRNTVDKASRGAVRRGDPTNVLGRISQSALLSYLKGTQTRPSSADKHSSVDPVTGKRRWDPEIAESQRKMVEKVLRQRDENGDLCETCPEIAGHPEGDREVVFMGGGYAAGKGSVQDLLALTGEGGLLHGARPPKYEDGKMVDPGDKNKTFLALDPDEIKPMIMERDGISADDPEANLLAYEEAWHIAQMAQKTAQARGLDVLVDGISNTSPDEVAKRMGTFTDRGYKPAQFFYVSVPTDVAVARAIKRAREAVKKSDKRYIPDQVMRAVHRDVSATVGAMMNDPRFADAHIQVFNTEERGNPRIAADKPGGQVGETVEDSELWDQFRAKGLESIGGVHEDAQHARYLQDLFTPEEKQDAVTPPQAWGNSREAATAAVPALQTAMEELMRDGVASRMGASIRGAGHPLDVQEIAQHSGTDVLVAPPKNMDEAAKKAARKWQGDWAQVPDLVRGSVVVDHEEDIGGALDAIRAETLARGWKIADVQNRFANVPESYVDTGPTPAGYKDLSMQVLHPSGNHVEIQIHVRSMWAAKELGGPETGGASGHSLYKRGQAIMDEVDRNSGQVTPEQTQELEQLMALAQALYSRAATETRRNGGA